MQVGFLPSSGHVALCRGSFGGQNWRAGNGSHRQARNLLNASQCTKTLTSQQRTVQIQKPSAIRLGNPEVEGDKQAQKMFEKFQGGNLASSPEDNCTVTNNRQPKVTFLLLQVSHDTTASPGSQSLEIGRTLPVVSQSGSGTVFLLPED